jgi:bifunctional UDP-N-acetylglucosamine pyrophosphorylase/glucosamine-1-phosphate N-acetyltransferase
MSDLSIVILAAGLGTRMKSAKAKVLHEAGGLALVEHVVRASLSLTEADRIVTVVGHQAEQVESLLAPYGIRFAEQTEQLGTGHALEVCRSRVPDHQGKLVVLYGDCPLLSPDTLRSLLHRFEESGAAATVITTELEDPTGYGRMILDDSGDVLAIVEHKVATPAQRRVRLINSGIYCFNAPLLWDHLGRIEPNPLSKEFYLTDIVEILRQSGHRVSSLIHSDAEELLGINTRVELAAVDTIFCRRKAEELMLSGVTIRNPETVRVEADVTVGQDSVIEAFSQLLGKTAVGQECQIGAGAILRDCLLGDRVAIEPYTIVNSSCVDADASVGPFARLRTDNHVEPGAHIGNFVELKNTRFGAGAKAGHLAYLGDAEVGAKSNIGAGTITCNYDGAKKHKTKVGDKAFIGSNATLVAPVEIGQQAYVAAGSVITEKVPSEALGIGRGRQVNKEGWVARRQAAADTKV